MVAVSTNTLKNTRNVLLTSCSIQMVAILVAFINDMGVCWRNTRPLAAFPRAATARAATAVAAADSAGLHYHVVQRPQWAA